MTSKTKSGIVVAEFRNDYLFGLPSNLRKPADWSEVYLLRKIRAAEDEIERSLNCYFTPKRIICEPDNRVNGPPLVKGVDYDIAEPAYDYDADFYIGERWGDIQLRHYPVHLKPAPKIVFAYPNIDNKIFTVPDTWIRLNGDFGRIRLVPDKVAIISSFTAFILSVFSGGRGIPQSIFVDYTAGFTGVDSTDDLNDNYSDLLELTKRLAVLNILEDAFVPGSVSNSADGLSQSFSFQIKDMRTNYDKQFEKFRNKVKGIRFAII